MRDFTWQMFEITGDIDAYLLYRACEVTNSTEDEPDTLVEPLSNVEEEG